MAQDTGAEAPPAARHLTFLDLPHETQKEIFNHCAQNDLICLALVSKHFRDLAAAQLYRNFHIVFPDDGDLNFDSPLDGLAGGLDTFVTSDYNYAGHLRDLSLDTLSAGEQAEQAYRSYLYSLSCGKFMSTLLHLLLRKAKALEFFRWNIRVELSRPVYKALHGISTLRHVHIRLQAGPSLYEAPPTLPLTASAAPTAAVAPPPPFHLTELLPPPPPPPAFVMATQPSIFYVPPPVSGPPPPIPKPPPRAKAPKKVSTANEPPTLSGFKDLKSLAVLDIDSLDIIAEIKSCVQNSSGTLTKLKLSFSDALGLQARKPAPEADPDDSEIDDEFQIVPMQNNTQGAADDASGPAKAFRAQEERKSQEAVLSRIFDVEPYAVNKVTKKPRDKGKDVKDGTGLTPQVEFVESLRAVSMRLMKGLNGANGSLDLTTAQKDILDTIEEAARKYLTAAEPQPSKGIKAGQEDGAAGPSTSPGEAKPDDGKSAKDGQGDRGILDSAKPKKKDGETDTDPDDIDIEDPMEQLTIDSPDASRAESSAGKDASSSKSASKHAAQPSQPAESSSPDSEDPAEADYSSDEGDAMEDLSEQRADLKNLGDKLELLEAQANSLSQKIQKLRTEHGPGSQQRLAEAEAQAHRFSQSIQLVQMEMRSLEQVIEEAEEHIALAIGADDAEGDDAEGNDAEDDDAEDDDAEGDDAEGDVAEDDDAEDQTPVASGAVDAKVSDAEKQTPSVVGADVIVESQNRRISEYIRSTRGMGLQSLSLYLIPVKAAVLSQAIDIHVLKRITLLNVGHQAPIWTMFARENKIEPLPLRKIFTDNVSLAFLTFVSQLEELHEFFILEHEAKYKPESFAPKTTTTIEHIRRLVLKKHLPTLKRLMIKNQANQSWDVNEKTVLLLGRRGKVLEELAVSMNIKSIHTLLQRIYGLVNLRALHVIHLRNDDTCVWVMRETRRFLVDTLAHYPEMKLEWISIDDGDKVDRIVHAEPSKKKKKKKSKGKEKVTAVGITGTTMFPIMPVDVFDQLSESDDDDEDDRGPLKLDLDPSRFYDTWGVRIFKKEVTSGKL